ncbi:MAG: lysozyme inhibitor LprI family protein [Pseudomonadota bacterium]
MRAFFSKALLPFLAGLLAVFPAEAADVESTCYTSCEAQTTSNPEYKACLSQKASAADAFLNEAYGILKSAVRRHAAEMGQSPKYALQSLKEAQKKWIAYRDVNCTFEDQLAFGGTSIGGNHAACLCALSLERAADFARVGRQLLSE